MKARLPQQRCYMVRDGASRLLTMRMDLLPRQHQSDRTLSILILRSRIRGVSKDESPAAATAVATWFETALRASSP